MCCRRALATLGGSGTSLTLRPLGSAKQSRAHHLDLTSDVDDLFGEVEVVHAQSECLALTESQPRADFDEDPIAVPQSRTHGQHTLGRPSLGAALCRGRWTNGAGAALLPGADEVLRSPVGGQRQHVGHTAAGHGDLRCVRPGPRNGEDVPGQGVVFAPAERLGPQAT